MSLYGRALRPARHRGWSRQCAISVVLVVSFVFLFALWVSFLFTNYCLLRICRLCCFYHWPVHNRALPGVSQRMITDLSTKLSLALLKAKGDFTINPIQFKCVCTPMHIQYLCFPQHLKENNKEENFLGHASLRVRSCGREFFSWRHIWVVANVNLQV